MAIIKPLYDKIVLKRKEERTVSAGGIVLPGKAAEKPDQGIIVAVGIGKSMDDGTVREMQVQVGDVVLFGKFSGVEFELENEKFLIIKEDDVMGIIK